MLGVARDNPDIEHREYVDDIVISFEPDDEPNMDGKVKSMMTSLV